MPVRLLLPLCFLLSFPSGGQGQISKQQLGLMTYNISFGVLTGGIGALINKPKGVPWQRQFLKGAWQGSIGGALQYSGKMLNTLVTKKQNLAYAWPAKLVHAAGTSITENAARSRPFLQYWNIDFGPARFDFTLHKQAAFRARFMPMSIYAFYFGAKAGTFDWKTTALTGNFAFRRTTYMKVGGLAAAGQAYAHTFMYTDIGTGKYRNITHEINHLFQYREYLVFNAWAEPLAARAKKYRAGRIINRWVYLDVPYFALFYGLDDWHTSDNPACYYDSFYEFEAEYFATGKYVYRCK